MKKIKKGSVVGRKSYGKDILCVVEKIVKNGDKREVAILKGITIRIEADAFLDDLEIMNPIEVQENIRFLDNKLENRIQKRRLVQQRNTFKQTREFLREKDYIN